MPFGYHYVPMHMMTHLTNINSAIVKHKQELAAKRRVFLHLPYHPRDPSSKEVQRLWRDFVSYPQNMAPLTTVTMMM